MDQNPCFWLATPENSGFWGRFLRNVPADVFTVLEYEATSTVQLLNSCPVRIYRKFCDKWCMAICRSELLLLLKKKLISLITANNMHFRGSRVKVPFAALCLICTATRATSSHAADIWRVKGGLRCDGSRSDENPMIKVWEAHDTGLHNFLKESIPEALAHTGWHPSFLSPHSYDNKKKWLFFCS